MSQQMLSLLLLLLIPDRIILEPMVATKLKGDFKTGKRINIKKIIPYIAVSHHHHH